MTRYHLNCHGFFEAIRKGELNPDEICSAQDPRIQPIAKLAKGGAYYLKCEDDNHYNSIITKSDTKEMSIDGIKYSMVMLNEDRHGRPGVGAMDENNVFFAIFKLDRDGNPSSLLALQEERKCDHNYKCSFFYKNNKIARYDLSSVNNYAVFSLDSGNKKISDVSHVSNITESDNLEFKEIVGIDQLAQVDNQVASVQIKSPVNPEPEFSISFNSHKGISIQFSTKEKRDEFRRKFKDKLLLFPGEHYEVNNIISIKESEGFGSAGVYKSRNDELSIAFKDCATRGEFASFFGIKPEHLASISSVGVKGDNAIYFNKEILPPQNNGLRLETSPNVLDDKNTRAFWNRVSGDSLSAAEAAPSTSASAASASNVTANQQSITFYHAKNGELAIKFSDKTKCEDFLLKFKEELPFLKYVGEKIVKNDNIVFIKQLQEKDGNGVYLGGDGGLQLSLAFSDQAKRDEFCNFLGITTNHATIPEVGHATNVINFDNTKLPFGAGGGKNIKIEYSVQQSQSK